MIPARLPASEGRRLDTLVRYEILDTSPEQAFDDITMLASQVCETPIALVSLVDKHRQWFKSRAGLEATDTHRDLSFCGHAILRDEIFVVEDALKDSRFINNPLVLDHPNIRFYAGAPLKTPAGENIGTLCVIDTIPRKLTEAQKNSLVALSRQVIAQIELRFALQNANFKVRSKALFWLT
jgi:GAF domain-containing protein